MSAVPIIWDITANDHDANQIKNKKRWHTHVQSNHEHRAHAVASASRHLNDHSHAGLEYERIAPIVLAKISDVDVPALTAETLCSVLTEIGRGCATPFETKAIRAPPIVRSVSPGLLELRTTKLRL